MQCPTCSVDLHMSDRQGVEIDYCPKCRGIWLDRGELEKLIELASATSLRSAPRSGQDYERESMDDDDHDSESRRRGYAQPQKKESWLSRLMDFE